ncbi:MAG: tetratricopeptide repeat protein [Candidatus Poribacteria bacterium]
MKKISLLPIIILLLIPIYKSTVEAGYSETEALELLEQGGYQRAAEILESLLPDTRDGAKKNRTLYILGNIFRKQNRWDKAIEYYRQVSEDYILSDYVKLHTAESYQAKSDYQNAIVWYERFLADHPKHPKYSSAQYQLAMCYMEAKNYETALKIYLQLIDNRRSGYARASRYQSGKAYEGLGQWQKAYLAYQQVIDSNSSDAIAVDALEKINALVAVHSNLKITREQRLSMGMVLFNSGKYTQARNEFRKVVANHRDKLSGKATYYIGRSYYRQRRYDSAIKEYRKIVNLYSASGYLTRALYQAAFCYKRKGQLAKGNQLLKDFVAQYSWSAWADNALYEIAESLKNRGQYSDAIKFYDQLTKQYTKSDFADDALWYIGWCYFKLGKYQDSITSLQTLIKKFPQSRYVGQAQYWLGKIYEKREKWESAKQVYDEIIRQRRWYYSIRARERIQSLSSAKRITVKDNPGISHYRRTKVTSDKSLWRDMEKLDAPRAQELIAAKAFDDTITELESLLKSGRQNRKNIYYNLILSRQKAKQFYQAYLDGFKLFRLRSLKDRNNASPIEAYKLIYPFYYRDIIEKYSQKYDIDPFFVIAMIRSESGYDAGAVSSAGAYGLMQVMPSTGGEIARKLKIRPFNPGKLFQPEINIHIGIWHMKNLMNSFDNNHALVSGAYNGGQGRMQRWVEKSDLSDIDEFIEDIPIDETRSHIKRVIDSYYIYRELYSES